MARIAGVNLPTNKRVIIALTYIHGIGNTKAKEIATKLNIAAERRVQDLSDQEVLQIREALAIDPTLVGNRMEVVVSELSGRGNLLSQVEEYGYAVNKEHVAEVLETVKKLEAHGFSFEAAEASVVMMFRRKEADYKPLFELIDFTALVEHRQSMLRLNTVVGMRVLP